MAHKHPNGPLIMLLNPDMPYGPAEDTERRVQCHVMLYAYYFVHVGGDPEMWARRLETSHDLLRDLAASALIRARALPDDRGDDFQVGGSRPLGQGFSVPLFWDAPGLFARLNGDLSVQPIEPGSTQLTLRASYSPDREGEAGETHRAVEAVIKRFLDSISASPG